MPDFQEIRKKFPLRDDLVWLNNCGVSVPPAYPAGEVKTYLDAFTAAGVLQTAKPHGQIKRNIQNYFAKFFGGSAHEYALLNNTAEGMTFIAQSLPLTRGDKILLVEREYPSNVYPFMQLKRQGIEIGICLAGLVECRVYRKY
jgi:cysteine desulfurase/selenocysteine lyase